MASCGHSSQHYLTHINQPALNEGCVQVQGWPTRVRLGLFSYLRSLILPLRQNLACSLPCSQTAESRCLQTLYFIRLITQIEDDSSVQSTELQTLDYKPIFLMIDFV